MNSAREIYKKISQETKDKVNNMIEQLFPQVGLAFCNKRPKIKKKNKKFNPRKRAKFRKRRS